MSYGERSDAGFGLPAEGTRTRDVLFSDVEHALSWHMVYHPEMWDAGTEEAREHARVRARAAVRERGERRWRRLFDGDSPRRASRYFEGRCDARLVSLFAAAYASHGRGTRVGSE